MKFSKDSQDFELLARYFLLQTQGQIPVKPSLFYPYKGRRDHAQQWAEALGQWLEVKPQPLRLKSQGKQSQRGRWERQKVEFYPKDCSPGPVLFVDDVVTTGSTGLSAHKALGQPVNFAIWSLFYRPSL